MKLIMVIADLVVMSHVWQRFVWIEKVIILMWVHKQTITVKEKKKKQSVSSVILYV